MTNRPVLRKMDLKRAMPATGFFMVDPTSTGHGHIQPVPFPGTERPVPHLPTPLTGFVGRDREVAAVADLLRRDGVRLVTLTGPGGVGKTRLALRIADELAPTFADGITFVPLAPIRDAERVLPAVARALGVRDSGDRPLDARLATALRDRMILLILDNLEQVLDAAPRVTDLLAACPSLTVLTTSRSVLHVSGEHDILVPPLALPGAERIRAVEELARTEAVALFVQRARAADRGFALTDANAAAVVAICRRLDGLPLAIELAASRVPVLSPHALEARLTERLRLLTGGARDQPPRLRTMRDAIGWSYDLLSPDDQALFRSLSVFAGGCTIEAAEDACGGAVPDVLDGITALVGHSLLVRVDSPGSTARFEMLETVREYAQERLVASGEAEAARARHAAYFVDLAGRPKLTWWVVEETIGEQANLRAALEWAIARGLTDLALPLGIAVWQLLEPAADYDAMERAVTATAGAPASLNGKRTLLLAATAQYAMWRSDDARVDALLEESRALAMATGAVADVALALLVLSLVTSERGDLGRGEVFAEEALRIWRVLGEPSWAGEALGSLAGIAHRRGDLARAERLFEESVGIARSVGPLPALALALGCLGGCVQEQGDHRRAAALLGEGIELASRGRDPIVLETNIAQLAALAAAAGQAESAARLFGAVAAWKERFGFDLSPSDRSWHARAAAPARAQLAGSAFAAAWNAGQAMTLNQAVSDALAVAEAVASTAPAHAPKRAAGPDALTPREIEVLRLLAEGLPNRAIGVALSISPETARRHATNIYAKLGVTSRAAATAAAHRRGLV